MRRILPFLAVAILTACASAPPAGDASLSAAPRAGAATSSTTPRVASTTHDAALPLAGRRVVIDAGHQLGNSRHKRQINKLVRVGKGRKACNTTGTATNSGYPEATFTFTVAQRLRKRLTKLGATVVLTRTANSRKLWGPCVDVRGKAGNGKPRADVKISIHGDGSRARAHGFHVIAPASLTGLTRPIAKPSRRLARDVRDALLDHGFSRSTYTGGSDAINVRSDLGTLNLSKVPVVMVELGNMRNARDAKVMRSSTGQRRYAAALADGIEAFLAKRP